ncbi:hypothetical protein RQM65_11505 [Pricia sp. S334]|uniref:Tetratricopeptide repeat protein n=1 Tax=Pricia mediterranea TaxID=3076079 RepID=A0ABU3L6D4_9FLAO|nr:hypothetical protein [Pricia sp. S334]MDT7829294.1 hypothetical protein [Pricia sp. S334]
MSPKDLTYLLRHPDKVVSPVQTNQLEEILEEFPYFQAARSLHLKGLKSLNSFKYNNALKVTAAYTTDREVLFDLITSEVFLQNRIADSLSDTPTPVDDIEVAFPEVVPGRSGEIPPQQIGNSVHLDSGENTPKDTSGKDVIQEESLPFTKAEADALLDPKLFASKDPQIDAAISEEKKQARKKLELGEPLPFTKKEKYSFSEWLQLSTAKPVKRKQKRSNDRKTDGRRRDAIDSVLEKNPEKSKKFELIDKFIADNPKIKPEKEAPKVIIGDSVKFDQKELMTETLAKVYLEQKKYKKAIQAYKILSLKYPEKSGFFADRIKSVERLKTDNA